MFYSNLVQDTGQRGTLLFIRTLLTRNQQHSLPYSTKVPQPWRTRRSLKSSRQCIEEHNGGAAPVQLAANKASADREAAV